MAENKSPAAKGEKAEPAVETPDEPEVQKVDRERLIASAYDFFGVDPHVVAGALAGMDARHTAFTPAEVEAEIKDFLKRPVKEG